MSDASNSAVRPFSDEYLLDYSKEHVSYEFDMFLWLAQLCGSRAMMPAPTTAEGVRLNNALIESFVVHLRNVIDFLYPGTPKATDIIAADFFDAGAWENLRPTISRILKTARVRANKEIAHLTTDRIKGRPPRKGWDFNGLATEIRPIMRLAAENALPARLSPSVLAVIG